MTTTRTKPVRARVSDVRPLITSRTPFRASTMRGDWLTAGTCAPGEMPDEWRPAWHDAVTTYGRRLFVVWSFETPIAWRGDDGHTVIPDVTYGQRTTRHQGIVRGSWSATVTTLPGEVQVRVVKVYRANGSTAFRVTGPNGTRTVPFDWEAPWDGKYEAAVSQYARDFLGLTDFRVNERHTRLARGDARYFVILPD